MSFLVAALVLGSVGAAQAQGGSDLTGTATVAATSTTTPMAAPAVEPAVPASEEAAPAEAEASAPDDVEATYDGEQLEEIIVTSQKRRENLQKVPVSVVSIGGEQASYLRSSGLDVRFLSARIPSLTVESSFGRTFPRFYIRGLGNTDFDLNASQPVLMVIDEIVQENPTLKGFPLFDLQNIEVLRGPQGTLFGRNTPAGIVKIQSKRPTWDYEAYGRATYGSFGFIGLEGAVSGPVIDDVLAARLSILYERRNGWVDNTFTGEEDAFEGFEDVAGRLQLLYTPTDQMSLLFNVHSHSLNGTARLFRANIIEPGTSDFVGGFERDQVSIDGANEQVVNQLGMNLTFKYETDKIIFTSIFGYESAEVFSRGDIDGGFGASFAEPSGPGFIPFPSESADGIPSLRQFTQELRFASNQWDVVNFQAGAFYFFEDVDIDSFSYDTFSNGAVNGQAFQNQKTTAFALFGSTTVDILENLRLAGGLRWSDDQKTFVAERFSSPVGAGALAPQNTRASDTFLSWDTSVTYGITRDVNLYAKLARSFRAPSIQGRVLFGDTLSVADSEKILSFEAGVKAELFDRRARINATGFFYELRDQQLTAVGGATNFNRLLNADKSRGSGFEIDAQVLPISNVLFTLGMSYNNTEIVDSDLEIVPCGGGCTVLDEPGTRPGTVNIDGNPLPHAPTWIVNATLRAGLPVHNDGELFLFADIAWRSTINFFLYESEEFKDDDLVELGLRAGYARYDGKLEVAVFSRNFNNNLSRTGGIDFNNLTGFVNEPRTFGVEGRWAF